MPESRRSDRRAALASDGSRVCDALPSGAQSPRTGERADRATCCATPDRRDSPTSASWRDSQLLLPVSGVVRSSRDRDPKWSRGVEQLLTMSGVRMVRTPACAPNCNAYAERFVRSIKEECLNRIVPLGERHLRRALAEYCAHYHGERNHQGLGNELIDRQPSQRTRGPVRRCQRMGGILSHYYRSAA